MSKAKLGSILNVTWTSQNLPSTEFVIIEVTYDGGNTWSTLNASHPNNGSYLWTVAGTAGQQVQFKVSDTQQPLDINAISNIITIAKKGGGFFFFFRRF